MDIRHRNPMWALAAATGLLVGCGGGAEPDHAGGSPAADTQSRSPQDGDGITRASAVEGHDCIALITPAEVDAITGVPGTKLVGGVRGDENEILAGETECSFELPQNHFMGVKVYTDSGVGEGLESFEEIWNVTAERGGTALPGFGERALFHADFSGGPRVAMWVRGRGILIDGAAFGDRSLDLEQSVKQVATTVVERL
jgi:hypothetical protein